MHTRLCTLTLLLVLIPAVVSAQSTVVVDQISSSFSPQEITIQVGDTVRWVWSSGTHTVTNGVGSKDANVGVLFDAPLDLANQQFQYTFTEAGDVPYFCRIHELLNMDGIVHVEGATPAPAAMVSLRLHGVEPNPFNPRSSIRFTLGSAGPISITVHDARGRLVRRLLDGVWLEWGEQRVSWDGRSDRGVDAPSGVYHFRVRTALAQKSTRGVLVR